MKHCCYVLALLLTALSGAFSQTTEKGLAGVWHGTLGEGSARLRLMLTITRTSAGTYTGTLDSLDQGATIPITTITVNGDEVRLEVKNVSGVYEGTLSKDRTEIVGKWTQGGVTQPLTFRAGAPTLAPATPAAPARRPLTLPLDVMVLKAPTPFQADGRTHLVYELHVTNFAATDCLLTRVEVLGTGDKLLAGYEGSELAALLARPGVPPATEKPRIGGGLRAVVYLWVTLEAGSAVPASLRHRLRARVGEFTDELSIETAAIAVGSKPIEISPPLRGSEWLAGNGPANASGHRRALIPVNGRAYIAQRFAIDWVQLREDGRTYTGDPKDNKNYRCYGTEALAVADATVAAIRDGIPENIPGVNSRAVPITLETIGGNYVILDLGQGRFAFYAHLQPGSLRVKVGDKVRRGQVVGLVGNSGNSTEPHLHFHLSDAGSPLGSEGLPYSFPAFEVQGRGWGWKPASPPVAPVRHHGEIPLENAVVRFPAAP